MNARHAHWGGFCWKWLECRRRQLKVRIRIRMKISSTIRTWVDFIFICVCAGEFYFSIQWSSYSNGSKKLLSKWKIEQKKFFSNWIQWKLDWLLGYTHAQSINMWELRNFDAYTVLFSFLVNYCLHLRTRGGNIMISISLWLLQWSWNTGSEPEVNRKWQKTIRRANHWWNDRTIERHFWRQFWWHSIEQQSE